MFEPQTIVAEALQKHPKAKWVFAAYHLGGCVGCGAADTETLEELSESYGIPLDQFLRDLNRLEEQS